MDEYIESRLKDIEDKFFLIKKNLEQQGSDTLSALTNVGYLFDRSNYGNFTLTNSNSWNGNCKDFVNVFLYDLRDKLDEAYLSQNYSYSCCGKMIELKPDEYKKDDILECPYCLENFFVVSKLNKSNNHIEKITKYKINYNETVDFLVPNTKQNIFKAFFSAKNEVDNQYTYWISRPHRKEKPVWSAQDEVDILTYLISYIGQKMNCSVYTPSELKYDSFNLYFGKIFEYLKTNNLLETYSFVMTAITEDWKSRVDYKLNKLLEAIETLADKNHSYTLPWWKPY